MSCHLHSKNVYFKFALWSDDPVVKNCGACTIYDQSVNGHVHIRTQQAWRFRRKEYIIFPLAINKEFTVFMINRLNTTNPTLS